MTDSLNIRESTPGDLGAIEALYPAAFPTEDLLPLVRALLEAGSDVLSLVALADDELAGHVAFTTCAIPKSAETVALLGPLAVAPTRQRQGIGTAMIRAGLRDLASAGAAKVCLLGDPGYYGRFGFMPETGVTPPYPLPAAWREAWQSIELTDGGRSLEGRLLVPAPWREPALWSA